VLQSSAEFSEIHLLPTICLMFLFFAAEMISSMQKYIEVELDEMKNRNSSLCIELVYKDSDIVPKLSQSIAERYKKVCNRILERVVQLCIVYWK